MKTTTLLIAALVAVLAVQQAAANCTPDAQCSPNGSECCAATECVGSDATFFCPLNGGNPFGMTCVNGQCAFPPPACSTGKQVCFTTKLDDHWPITAPNTLWLTAVFKPKFSYISNNHSVSFTQSTITINGASFPAPDGYVRLDKGCTKCSLASYEPIYVYPAGAGRNVWKNIVPFTSYGGNYFLSAMSVPIPTGVNWKGATVSWCGTVTAPGSVVVSISAAKYTSCSLASANPVGCDILFFQVAGAPTGCFKNFRGISSDDDNYCGSSTSSVKVC